MYTEVFFHFCPSNNFQWTEKHTKRREKQHRRYRHWRTSYWSLSRTIYIFTRLSCLREYYFVSARSERPRRMNIIFRNTPNVLRKAVSIFASSALPVFWEPSGHYSYHYFTFYAFRFAPSHILWLFELLFSWQFLSFGMNNGLQACGEKKVLLFWHKKVLRAAHREIQPVKHGIGLHNYAWWNDLENHFRFTWAHVSKMFTFPHGAFTLMLLSIHSVNFCSNSTHKQRSNSKAEDEEFPSP